MARWIAGGGSGGDGTAVRGARVARPSRCSVRYPLVTTPRLVLGSERDRLTARLVNTGSNTLKVAHGTLDSNTAPAAGAAYTDVPPGSEWVSADARPVFAYYATTADFARVEKEMAA